MTHAVSIDANDDKKISFEIAYDSLPGPVPVLMVAQ